MTDRKFPFAGVVLLLIAANVLFWVLVGPTIASYAVNQLLPPTPTARVIEKHLLQPDQWNSQGDWCWVDTGSGLLRQCTEQEYETLTDEHSDWCYFENHTIARCPDSSDQ